MGRVFVVFAGLSLLVVAAMGVLLTTSFSAGAKARGLEAAKTQAQVIATSSVEPALAGRDAASGLDVGTLANLRSMTVRLRDEGRVLRLRLRSPEGLVVFSDDGSGFGGAADDEALEALEGEPHASLTRLNVDAGDSGAAGVRAVEVYRALGPATHRQGVLELYLPYAPIQAESTAGLHRLYRDLSIGLAALYVVLVGLALTTTRRLRAHAARNAFLAEHDLLTDLPNRRRFHREIERHVADPDRPGGVVAVVDLDRFKEVNDSLGHHNGDALLQALAERLSDAVGPDDVLARLGGDEFGLVLAHVHDAVAAREVLVGLRRLLSQNVQVSGISVTPEASIGFALVGRDGTDAESLLQRADIAMYVAKGSTDGVVRFDDEQVAYDADRLAMVGELQRAMAEDELVLHLQPKLDLRHDRVVGLEALLRWQHPRHGLIYPDTFLPLAEQTGLIDPLTDWVLDRGLRLLGELGLPADVRLSVNVSARNLGHEHFAERVLAVVAASDVPPQQLVLEITETAVFSDVERATRTLHRLAAAGIAISLDDFGQGQTSIGHLSRLPLRELKIDREFVRDMLTDKPHRTIVQSLVGLAHNLGLTVVAEGVEDDETRAALTELGCDEGQGYGIARPMDVERLQAWLADAGVPATTAQEVHQ
ncbi:hypothetical protein GCM10027446_20960 [Angustibacter peucedani]